MPKGGASKFLTTLERQHANDAMRLVTVGGLETTTKVLRGDREVGLCDNTLQFALRDVELSACERYLSLECLSPKKVRERQ